MQYRPYFKLSLNHAYYPQSSCPDFVVEPTRECRRFMQRHRWVLKPGLNGLQILIPFDSHQGDAPQRLAIPFDESHSLTFFLTLKNPDFANFTQLDPLYQPGRSFYVFSNDISRGEAAGNENSNRLDGLPLDVTVVQLQKLIEIAAAARGDPGFLDPLLISASALEKHCAAIAELQSTARAQIFGVVVISLRGLPAQASGQRANLTATFIPKAQVWRYYLVIDSATAASSFSIRDTDNVFPFSQVPIDRAESSSARQTQQVVTRIQQQFPDAHPVLFQSDEPITCRKIGKPNLQLIKQDSEKPWIAHLPNPPNQHGVQVINLRQDM